MQQEISYKSSYWKITFLLLVLLLVIVGGVYGYRMYFLHSVVSQDNYRAVFMENGQVYFGKMTSEKNGYVTLEHVYYIQNTNSVSGVGGTEISLVRMGSELHAPLGVMYINKDHIMFYEDLRPDSQVVKSILDNEQK